MRGLRAAKRAQRSQDLLFGKGHMASAVMGSLQISCFLTGTFRVLPFPKVPGRTFFPNLSKLITFAAAPSVDPIRPQPRSRYKSTYMDVALQDRHDSRAVLGSRPENNNKQDTHITKKQHARTRTRRRRRRASGTATRWAARTPPRSRTRSPCATAASRKEQMGSAPMVVSTTFMYFDGGTFGIPKIYQNMLRAFFPNASRFLTFAATPLVRDRNVYISTNQYLQYPIKNRHTVF